MIVRQMINQNNDYTEFQMAFNIKDLCADQNTLINLRFIDQILLFFLLYLLIFLIYISII